MGTGKDSTLNKERTRTIGIIHYIELAAIAILTTGMVILAFMLQRVMGKQEIIMQTLGAIR